LRKSLWVLLLKVKSEELDVLLHKSLSTQQAEGMSFRRRSCGEEVRAGWSRGRRRWRLAKHQIANILRMMMN
jgi:hypothetical protein